MAKIVDAKKQYERSVAAVKELVQAGIITQEEADREIMLAQDTLNKIKSGNIDKIRKGGCLPIMAPLEKKRAAEGAKSKASSDMFGMTEEDDTELAAMTREKAQKKIDQAMLNNDPAAMQAAVDALKDMESKGKNRKAMLHDLGHWGGHTLGRTHLEHQMQVGLAPIAPIDGLCLSLAHA